MCVQYIWRYSVHRWGGGGIQYIGGCSAHQRDTMSTSGDVQYIGGSMSTLGDIMSTSRGYHKYIGGCSVHWGMFSTSEFSIEIERILSSCSPTCIMISLRCTEHPLMFSWYPLMYSWYASNVLNISCDVLMVSPHSSWYPPMYWTPPNVLNTLRCTEHPPMYWASPNVLNTHYTGWECLLNAQLPNTHACSSTAQEFCLNLLLWLENLQQT